VLALITTPGEAGATKVAEVPDAHARPGEVLLRPWRVGVCGTDREIHEGQFGVAPEGEQELILGHELIARVEAGGHGFERGDLVCATVRRSCGHCEACAQDSPDACLTGDYLERGITKLHGFAAELVSESPEHLVSVPPGLGALAVLGEPASICARGIRHATVIGGRQPWRRRRALVLGTGAIGMLATMLLLLEDFEVWAAGRSPASDERATLAAALGATYFSTKETPAQDVAADAGGFDVVLEATGDAQVMADTLGLLGRNGVACLLGIDGRPREVCLDGRQLGVDAILQNRAVFGSVNAHREDWETAVGALDRAQRRWPDVLPEFVGLSVGVDEFAKAFDYRGVKAVLTFEDGA
jgi:threonine dehydrogenase-like Zn-dependent dehydrogenase